MPSIYSMSTLQLAYSWLTAYTGSKLRRRSSTDIEAEPFTGAVDELSCQKIRKLGNGISSPCPLRIMSASCPHHVRIISASYPHHTRIIPASYPHHVRIISASYPHHIIQKEVTPFISHSLGISHPKSLHTTTSNPIPSHLHTCTPLHTSTARARAFTTTNLHFLLTTTYPHQLTYAACTLAFFLLPFHIPSALTWDVDEGIHPVPTSPLAMRSPHRAVCALTTACGTCSTHAAHVQHTRKHTCSTHAAHVQHTRKHTCSTHASTHGAHTQAHMQHTCSTHASTHAAHMEYRWSALSCVVAKRWPSGASVRRGALFRGALLLSTIFCSFC